MGFSNLERYVKKMLSSNSLNSNLNLSKTLNQNDLTHMSYNGAIGSSNMDASQNMDMMNTSGFKNNNPLQFKFRSNDDKFQHNNQSSLNNINSNNNSQLNNTGFTNGRSRIMNKHNPLQSNFAGDDSNELKNTYTKEEIHRLRDFNNYYEESKNKNINTRETPYAIENLTGADLIFSIKFFNLTNEIYLNNLEVEDLEYPFSLEQMIKRSSRDKAFHRSTVYRVYFVSHDQEYCTFLFEGKDLDGTKNIKIPFKSRGLEKESAEGSEIGKLNYILLEFDRHIMKKSL